MRIKQRWLSILNLPLVIFLAGCPQLDLFRSTEVLKEEANHGSAWAQIILADRLLAEGNEKSTEEALRWLFAAADQGQGEANYVIATYYFNPRGTSIPLDPVEGEARLVEAARSGSVHAQELLARRYYESKRYEESVPWMERRAAEGDGDALFSLAEMYFVGLGVSYDYRKAHSLMSQAADAGNLTARRKLAYIPPNFDAVDSGSLLTEDVLAFAQAGYAPAIEEVFRDFRSSRTTNTPARFSWKQIQSLIDSVPIARSMFAWFHYEGAAGVAKDTAFALSEWTELSESGETHADFYLAYYYAEKEQYELAEKHLIEAANGLVPPAAHEYGLQLLYGNWPSIEKDPKLGVAWIKSAAETHPPAILQLAKMQLLGNHVEKDVSTALSTLEMLSDTGMYDAHNTLASVHSSGIYIEPNYSVALSYYEKAAMVSEQQVANSFAWFLATCPDPTIQDGDRAVYFGELALQSSPDSPFPLDTTAAAYARRGDFAAAIAYQEKAIEAARRDGLDLSGYEERLVAYQNEQPWVEHVSE